MPQSRLRTFVPIFVVLVLLLVPPAAAGGFVFTKLVDTATPIPGAPGQIFEVFETPAIHGDRVVFVGWGSDPADMMPGTGMRGVYVADRAGNLRLVAASEEGQFATPSIHDGKVAFFRQAVEMSIVLEKQPGPWKPEETGHLTEIARTNDGVPSLVMLSAPSVLDGHVVYWGSDASGNGFVFRGGELIAGSGTPSTLLGAGFPAPLGDGSVAFRGWDGMFSEIDRAHRDVPSASWVLESLAKEKTTKIPGSVAPFASLKDVRADRSGDRVLFIGSHDFTTPPHRGLYTLRSGQTTPEVIVDRSTDAPGGAGKFTDFRWASIDQGRVVFSGRDENGEWAIYSTIDGVLRRVFAPGEKLDGKTTGMYHLAREAISGRSITFLARFSDGSKAVYRAEAPALYDDEVKNWDFDLGLGGWTPSGGGSVGAETDKGESVARLQTDAAPAVLEQDGIVTPPVPFALGIDYRFATTAGRLEVLLDSVVLETIEAPATVSETFTHAVIVVRDPALLDLRNAALTLKLHHGSKSDVRITAAGILKFPLNDRTMKVNVACTYGSEEDAEDASSAPPNWGSQETASAECGSGNRPLRSESEAVSRASDFGTVELGAASYAGSVDPSNTSTHGLAESRFQIVGPSPVADVDLNYSLTGRLSVHGDGMAGVSVIANLRSARLGNVPIVRGGLLLWKNAGAYELVRHGDLADSRYDGSFVLHSFAANAVVTVHINEDFEDAIIETTGSLVGIRYRLDTTGSGLPGSSGETDFLHTLSGTLESDTPGITFRPETDDDPLPDDPGMTADLTGTAKLKLTKIAKVKDGASMGLALDDGSWTATDGNGGSSSGSYVQTDKKGRKFRLTYDDPSLQGLLAALGQSAADAAGNGGVVAALGSKAPRITVKLNRKRTRMTVKIKLKITGTADGDPRTRKGSYKLKLKGPVTGE